MSPFHLETRRDRLDTGVIIIACWYSSRSRGGEEEAVKLVIGISLPYTNHEHNLQAKAQEFPRADLIAEVALSCISRRPYFSSGKAVRPFFTTFPKSVAQKCGHFYLIWRSSLGWILWGDRLKKIFLTDCRISEHFVPALRFINSELRTWSSCPNTMT